MKLNLGCGHLPLDGYVNVDQYAAEADVKGDVRLMTFEGVEECVSYHMLEHLGWQDTHPLLCRVHSWMVPGGKLLVEVPDMEKILEEGLKNPACMIYIYGAQEHEGEYHRSGFTVHTLAHAVHAAGFNVKQARRFPSPHPVRQGMPCIEVEAYA